MILKLMAQINLKNKSPIDEKILYTLYKIKRNFNGKLDGAQAKFLLCIWEFLRNKTELRALFDKTLYDVVQEEKIKKFYDLEEYFFLKNVYHIELESLLKSLNNSQLTSKEREYSLSLDNTMFKKRPLNEYSRCVASRLLYVIDNHFETLAKIVCSDNISEKKFSFNYFVKCDDLNEKLNEEEVSNYIKRSFI